MANRRFNEGLFIGDSLVYISGSFLPLSGAGVITASQVKGFGFGYAPVAGIMALQPSARPGISSTPGIVRTGAGIYTVTLDDSYLDCNRFSCDLTAATTAGTGNFAQPVLTISNLGAAGLAPTFTLLTVNSGGTPTDLGPTFRVYFEFVLRNSTEQFSKP